MANPKVTIRGIGKITSRFGGQVIKKHITTMLKKALLALGKQASIYPPPRGYVRTFKLQRGWTSAAPKISGFTGRITNKTPHGPFVQDEREQAAVHRGHWDTQPAIISKAGGKLQEIADDTGKEIERDLS